MARKKKLPEGMWQRGKVYYARFRHNGKLIRKKLDTDFEAACEELTRLKLKLNRKAAGEIDNDFPLEKLKEEYLKAKRQEIRPSSVKRIEHSLNRMLKALPVVDVDQLTNAHIRTYRAERKEGQHSDRKKGQRSDRTPAVRTINLEVGALAAMLNWAVQEEKIGSNPISVKPLDGPKAKKRRALTAEEVEALFKHSPDYLKPVWRMFACTGIRKGELVAMRFDDIDFEAKTATVLDITAKNGREREIFLEDGILAMLRELQKQATHRRPVEGRAKHITAGQLKNFSKEHVFVTQANTPLKNNLLKRFYAVAKRAGIEGAHSGGSVDIHSLRGTFATLALEGGATPKAVQEILGHATIAMTMDVYAKATNRGKREAIASLPFAKVSEPEHIVKLPSAHNAHE